MKPIKFLYTSIAEAFDFAFLCRQEKWQNPGLVNCSNESEPLLKPTHDNLKIKQKTTSNHKTFKTNHCETF